MGIFFQILLQVIAPIFLLIVAGALLHRKFSFDMNTLSKLTTYFLMPAVGFTNIYESRIGGGAMLDIVSFLALQGATLMVITAVTAKVFKFERSLAASFKNTVVLSNNGNYGIPVAQLVFHSNPLGQSIQVIAMIFQNLLTYTYGLMNSVSVDQKASKSMLEFLKLPILYALILGFLLQAWHVTIPAYVYSPIEKASDAFLAVALVTLGAQCAFLDLKKMSLPLVLSLAGRLAVSPAIAVGIIWLLGLEGTTAQALFIASSFPTSRNSALFALEYNNHPEYAAQAVLMSTLCSGVTVALVVYLSSVLY